MICWKIRIFAYWTTPRRGTRTGLSRLWFAEKFVSLLIEQHLHCEIQEFPRSCDLLKNSYLCLLNNTKLRFGLFGMLLWFAEKFVSLLIEQHLFVRRWVRPFSCDLLKNSYLCLLNNTLPEISVTDFVVVICWKIRIFAYWTTPFSPSSTLTSRLWFAEKFVSLLIEQHRTGNAMTDVTSCDLLKNSYLCLLNNTLMPRLSCSLSVVICWKIRIFAYWTTPILLVNHLLRRCDLLKNSYLCLLNNTVNKPYNLHLEVVICWKIRIFAYWTTPLFERCLISLALWFAEKFVSLLIEQHLIMWK